MVKIRIVLSDLYEVRDGRELYWARSMTEAVRWLLEKGEVHWSVESEADEDQGQSSAQRRHH